MLNISDCALCSISVSYFVGALVLLMRSSPIRCIPSDVDSGLLCTGDVDLYTFDKLTPFKLVVGFGKSVFVLLYKRNSADRASISVFVLAFGWFSVLVKEKHLAASLRHNSSLPLEI
jgi:hypothetical protein